MKLALALCVFLLPVSAYADEIVGNLNDNKVVQSELLSRVIGEIGNAVNCKVAESRTETKLKDTEATLKDADQAQDELQDAGD